MRDCTLLDRTGLKPKPAPGGAIRLCQYECNLKSGSDQRVERNGRKFRRAGEQKFHVVSTLRSPQLARVTKPNLPATTAVLHDLALLFLELGENALLLKARQVIDENLTLQVVHFMLNAHRQQAIGPKRETFALCV